MVVRITATLFLETSQILQIFAALNWNSLENQSDNRTEI